MGLTHLSKAKQWIMSGFGSDDPVKLVEAVNRIRRDMYGWYAELNLFVDATECFEVQRFCFDCSNAGETYLGVTLPRDFAQVEAMWYDGLPVRLLGRWRHWHSAITPACACGLEKHDMGSDFPTERDLIPGYCERIRVMAMDKADEGKTMIVRGVSVNGPATVEFKLSTTPQATELPFVSIDRHGGVSMEAMKGRVIISAESGRVLSIYSPGENVPTYTRIRITGIPDGCAFVNITAARNYVELFDDLDVVETDNQAVWEAMGRCVRINRKQDRDKNDLASEQQYLLQAKTMLLGDKSREMGKSTEGKLTVRMPNFRGYQLIGRSRRW